jgi:hypothetical protein
MYVCRVGRSKLDMLGIIGDISKGGVSEDDR